MVTLIDHYCDQDEITVCRESLQENSYMMNPENILLAMLGTYIREIVKSLQLFNPGRNELQCDN